MFNYDTLQIYLNVKKARNVCNNHGRETKENRSSLSSAFVCLRIQKEIDYIK